MTALTEGRTTRRRDGRRVSDLVAAATVLFVGGMYALNASGYAVPAGTAGAGAVRGLALATADNSAGIAGAINVEGERTVAHFVNADSIGRTNIGQLAYAVDDQTVAKSDGGGTRSSAGVIVDVDSTGVWVDVGAVVFEADSTILVADKLISSAQLLALNATPVTVIAAPGAGFALAVIDVQVRKPSGTAYDGIAAGEDISLRYTNGSGAAAVTLETTGFLDQATEQHRYAPALAAAALAPVANAPIVAALATGEIATGNTDLHLRVRYRVLDLTIEFEAGDET